MIDLNSFYKNKTLRNKRVDSRPASFETGTAQKMKFSIEDFFCGFGKIY